MGFLGYLLNAFFSNWVLLVTFTLLYRFFKFKNRPNFPPGPRGIPFIGASPFLGRRPEVTFAKWARKYGDIIGFNMGQSYAVVLSSYDVMQDALAKQGPSFNYRPNSHIFVEALGKTGIGFHDFTPDFIRERKFTAATLRKLAFGKATMEEHILEEARHFLEHFKGRDIDLNDATKETIVLSMANIMAQMTFGKRFNYQDSDLRTITNGWLCLFHEGSTTYLATTLFSWLKHVPPIRQGAKAIKRALEKICGVVARQMNEHERTLDVSCARDFIDEYLIQLKKKSLPNDGGPFSEDMLKYTVRDLFGAGLETTSTVIVFGFLILANKPEIMKKIHAEIDDVIGDDRPSFELRKNMPYFHAFIIELLRCRTPAPLCLPHSTSEDITFKGYFIPKEAIVFPNLYAVHHDPDLWPEPERFDPERHLDNDGKVKISKYFIPFGVGSRMCVGWRLAEMELFIMLASIFRRYDVVPKPNKEGERPLVEDDARKTAMSIFPPDNTPVTLVNRNA